MEHKSMNHRGGSQTVRKSEDLIHDIKVLRAGLKLEEVDHIYDNLNPKIKKEADCKLLDLDLLFQCFADGTLTSTRYC